MPTSFVLSLSSFVLPTFQASQAFVELVRLVALLPGSFNTPAEIYLQNKRGVLLLVASQTPVSEHLA